MQANETFAFVGNVTHYAKVWLNISSQLRTFLEEGKLHNHLTWLQQVTHTHTHTHMHTLCRGERQPKDITLTLNPHHDIIYTHFTR